MAPHKLHISDKLKSWWRIFIKSHGYGKQAAAVNCGLSPCLFNSSCLYAAGAPDIPSILAHRQAALSFCRSPGIGHIQFPLRRYSGKRHRCRFSCSLLVSCGMTECNIFLIPAIGLIRNCQLKFSCLQHRLQICFQKMCFVFHPAVLHQLFACLRGIEAQRNNLTPNIFIWSVDWYGNWSGIRSSRVKVLVGPIENNHESRL